MPRIRPTHAALATTIGALALGAVAVAPAQAASTPPAAAASSGTVYLVQGVKGSVMDLSVDGRVVAEAAPAKRIVGPMSLAPGRHTVSANPPGSGPKVSASITVGAGSSTDAVLHRTVNPAAPPAITTFANDLSAVSKGSGRVSVAHTAAVGPADVRVNGAVLFTNVSNGQALSAVVPAASYQVDVVPTGTPGPAIFGPVTLSIRPTALTRVFAVGVGADKSMDAIVQVLPLSARGSGSMPGGVDAGTGGQAQELIDASRSSGSLALGAWQGAGLAAVVGAGGLVLLGARTRRRRAHVG